jgi:Mg2+-importing ATPase
MVEETIGNYSSMKEEELFSNLNSSKIGLSSAEVQSRLFKNGKNIISESKELSILLEFLSHFKSPLVFILLIAAIVSYVFGDIVNSIIIGVIVLLSVLLDFFLEHHAGEAAKKLKERVQTTVTVIRDSKEIQVLSSEVCVGDVIVLNAGSMIPADARVIFANDFFVNQSVLTGESFPCEKITAPSPSSNCAVSEMKNIVFMGTNVTTGSARAIVVKVGSSTEFGKISGKLSEREEKSDFDKGMANFGYLAMKVILVLTLLIFLFNSLIKHQFLESFTFAIAVAVGLTPELLPMIMSITMARGSLAMAKKGVIVKKQSAIPNFGSMDILCTDKTGTLTEDKIELVKCTDYKGKESELVFEYSYFNSFYQTGIKNPLDQAILDFKVHHSNITLDKCEKLDEIPFDFVRKKMSVVVKKGKKVLLVTKGAPEDIISSCKYYYDGKIKKLTPQTAKKIIEQYHNLSSDGFRTLGVAVKEIGSKKSYSKADEVGLTFYGFASFLDPPKADAQNIISELNALGVRVKIITGDNELVTRKICADLKIQIHGVLLGPDALNMTDDVLRQKVEATTIFARFSPDQKNRVITALRRNGHVVGYMGDGINDAESLKNADIGISVNSAVDVAKESADIVLTEKSLDVLRQGIIDGRKTFGNTMKYIKMNLSSNFGNMFSYTGAVLFLPFLPMLPIQILLNNFIYDFAQITIPGDNVDSDMTLKPKKWDLGYLKRYMLIFGPVSSLFDFITFGVLFFVFGFVALSDAAMFQTGWFMESLATQTLVILLIRTNGIPFVESKPSKMLFFSSIACVAVGWTLPYTKLGQYLGFVPLPMNIVLVLVAIVAAYFIVIEVVKKVFKEKIAY